MSDNNQQYKHDFREELERLFKSLNLSSGEHKKDLDMLIAIHDWILMKAGRVDINGRLQEVGNMASRLSYLLPRYKRLVQEKETDFEFWVADQKHIICLNPNIKDKEFFKRFGNTKAAQDSRLRGLSEYVDYQQSFFNAQEILNHIEGLAKSFDYHVQAIHQLSNNYRQEQRLDGNAAY